MTSDFCCSSCRFLILVTLCYSTNACGNKNCLTTLGNCFLISFDFAHIYAQTVQKLIETELLVHMYIKSEMYIRGNHDALNHFKKSNYKI